MLEPAGEADAAGRLRAASSRSRRAAGRGRRRASAAAAPRRPRAPPAGGELARGPRSPARERAQSRSQRSVDSPKPTISRRAPGLAAWTSGQAASSRSTPLETISLPTKITRGPSAAANQSSASAAGRGSRSQCAPPLGALRRRRVPPAPRGAAGRSGGGIGANSWVSTPGGPSRTLAFVRGRRRPAGGGRRCGGADEDPGGAVDALLGVRAEAVEVGDHRVREIRAVDLEREGRPARARITGPMTRWLASAASTPPSEPTRSRTARDVALEVAVELVVGELGEGLDLESPRSCRRRRPAGGRRCRGCIP